MRVVSIYDDEPAEAQTTEAVESPLPFDELLALTSADVQDFTDMIVTIAREELEKEGANASQPGEHDDLLTRKATMEAVSDEPEEPPVVYRSDDAPFVGPFSDKEPDEADE
jgi:hypothetical protein